MEKALDVLVVCCQLENTKTLLGVFRDLPIKAHSVSKLAQANEFMANHRVDMVFCDEWLPDGSYRGVLARLRDTSPAAQFVLLMLNGEGQACLEASRLGVEEVLRPPLRPIDVDLAFVHSFRHAEHDLVSQN